MGAYRTRSGKSRGLGYTKCIIVILVIGFSLKHKTEVREHLGLMWDSAHRLLAIERIPPKTKTIPPLAKIHPVAGPKYVKPEPPPVSPLPPPATPAPVISPPQASPISPASVELVLHSGERGHFFTTVQINGHSVKVMVDTGASLVSIPAHLQAALDLPLGRPISITTASDRYSGNETTIQHLAMGPIHLQNIPANLNPRSPNGEILLGMSVLKNLEIVQKNDTLTLRAPLSMAMANMAVQMHKLESPPPEPLKIKRSVRECMGEGKMIDQKVLECIKGN